MNRDKQIIKVSIQGIVVNVILVVFKIIIGLIVNSIAIVLDAINNLSDAMSSIITIIGTKLSGKRPNKKHPYGYGRIEYFSSIIIAIIVFLAGITSLKESFKKIINPVSANYSIVSLLIIVVAILVKFFFGRYVKNRGEKYNSQSLIASGTDAVMDAFLSLSTLIAAIVSMIWHISLEGYLGFIISLIIIKSSIEILSETINSIIGIREDSALTKKIKDRINSFDDVEGTYDLALHNYGPSKIIGSAHIQVKDDMSAKEIHSLTRKITVSIALDFGITLTIGIYAANEEGEFKNIKNDLIKIVKKYNEIIEMHGFYVDTENKTITFDLIIDFKVENPELIKNKVLKEIKSKYSKYNYYVILDSDFSD